MKKLISKTAREIIKKELPFLDIYGYHMWSFACSLMFSPWVDEETGAIRVGLELVARTTGNSHKVQIDPSTGKKSAKHFVAKTVIEDFINLMPKDSCELLEYSLPYGENAGKQRRIIINWPDAIKRVIEDELTGVYKDDEKVYIVDGSSITYRKQKAAFNAELEEAANITDVVATPSSKKWIKYLNGLPTNTFTKMLANLELARKEAMNIANPHARSIALKQLDIISEQPLPIYKATPRTTRIYTTTASIQNLPKNLRKILMAGHIEFDLHHLQLAIIAKLWNIPSVDSFLYSKRSLWKELITHFGLDVNSLNPEIYEEIKWYLKKYTYSTVFGMNESNIKHGNKSKLERLERLGIKTNAKKITGLDADLQPYGINNAGDKFASFPLIRDILEARERMLKQLDTVPYLINAFGEVVGIKKGFTKQDILAQVAQSYEIYLLNPVLDFVNNYKNDVTISLFQHDGFSIKIHNNQYKDEIIACIVNGVNEWCSKSGFNTWLEYSVNDVYNGVVVEKITNEQVNELTEEELTTEISKQRELLAALPDNLEEEKEILVFNIRLLSYEKINKIYYKGRENEKYQT